MSLSGIHFLGNLSKPFDLLSSRRNTAASVRFSQEDSPDDIYAKLDKFNASHQKSSLAEFLDVKPFIQVASDPLLTTPRKKLTGAQQTQALQSLNTMLRGKKDNTSKKEVPKTPLPVEPKPVAAKPAQPKEPAGKTKADDKEPILITRKELRTLLNIQKSPNASEPAKEKEVLKLSNREMSLLLKDAARRKATEPPTTALSKANTSEKASKEAFLKEVWKLPPETENRFLSSSKPKSATQKLLEDIQKFKA